MSRQYDVIIIGSGPAGLSAALYASRAKLSTLVLEKSKKGGQAAITHLIENYPGAVEDPTGPRVTARMVEQAKSFGAEIKQDEVLNVELEGDEKVVTCVSGDYTAKTVIIATGASPRKLDAPGIKELESKGISYCATCDGDFFEGLDVYVVGGANSAVEEALFLTKFARKVTIVYRRENVRCEKVTAEKAKNNPKIEILGNTVVTEAIGDGILEAIRLKNLITGEEYVIEADEEDGTMGLFFFIGYIPQTKLFEGKVEMTEDGYIKAGEDTKTNVDGVFVAGDCRVKDIRQVVTAVSDGAVAAIRAEKYIAEKFE